MFWFLIIISFMLLLIHPILFVVTLASLLIYIEVSGNKSAKQNAKRAKLNESEEEFI